MHRNPLKTKLHLWWPLKTPYWGAQRIIAVYFYTDQIIDSRGDEVYLMTGYREQIKLEYLRKIGYP